VSHRWFRGIIYGFGYVAVVAGAVVAPLYLLAPLRSTGEPVPGPTGSATASEPYLFIPPTHREGTVWCYR
jgi:hypothetical protein